MDYRALCDIPETMLSCSPSGEPDLKAGRFSFCLENTGSEVAFAVRIRLVNPMTGEAILPAVMSDGYVTLMPGEKKTIQAEADPALLKDGVRVLLKPFSHPERPAMEVTPDAKTGR